MSLTATVLRIVTCEKNLPGKPKIDVVTLSFNDHAYSVETPVGQLTVGQTVAVEASRLDNAGIPGALRLTS